MAQVVFPAGVDFEAEAIAQNAFESADQMRLAARALERAGLLIRAPDPDGRDRWIVASDVTTADLAFAVTAEHKRVEEGG